MTESTQSALDRLQDEVRDIKTSLGLGWRHKVNFTQLCEELGISTRSYRRYYEQGKVTLPPPGRYAPKGVYSYDEYLATKKELLEHGVRRV